MAVQELAPGFPSASAWWSWVSDEALAFRAAHPEGVVVLDPHLRVVED